MKKVNDCPILRAAGVDSGDAGFNEGTVKTGRADPDKNWIKNICGNCEVPECLFLYPSLRERSKTWEERYKKEIKKEKKKMIRRNSAL